MKRLSWLLLLPALLLALFSTPEAQAQERRGWSPQAKGAVIGGAAGILGGALINGRNRKVGALIGGAGGAAAGFGVGKIIDSKQKKKAALAAERAAANERLAAANARAAAAERAASERAEERAAAERAAATRVAASQAAAARAGAAVATVPATAVATTALVAAATPEPTVAAGYLPNRLYGVAGTPYPYSKVLRKSW